MKVGDLVKANPAWILGDEIQRAAGLRLLKNGIVVEVRHDGWVMGGFGCWERAQEFALVERQ